jgi:hypothetical protein
VDEQASLGDFGTTDGDDEADESASPPDGGDATADDAADPTDAGGETPERSDSDESMPGVDETGRDKGAGDATETASSSDTVTESDAEWIDPAAVEPIEPTLSATSGDCAACGERVSYRWETDAGLVCPDCKAWKSD